MAMTVEQMENLVESGFLPATITSFYTRGLEANAEIQVLDVDTIRVGTHPDTGEPNGFVQVINNEVVAGWLPNEIVWVHADPTAALFEG